MKFLMTLIALLAVTACNHEAPAEKPVEMATMTETCEIGNNFLRGFMQLKESVPLSEVLDDIMATSTTPESFWMPILVRVYGDISTDIQARRTEFIHEQAAICVEGARPLTREQVTHYWLVRARNKEISLDEQEGETGNE